MSTTSTESSNGPDLVIKNDSAKVRFSPDSTIKANMDELKESFGSVTTLKITGNIFSLLVLATYCPVGKCVYVSDTENHRICKVDPHTGRSSVFAGTGMKGARNGPLYEAQFNSPRGIAMDPTNGDLFIADMWNHCVRKISAAHGMVSTVVGCTDGGFLDGPKDKALFTHPYSVALDHLSRDLYVTDYGNKRIRVVPLGDGPVTTIAGTGRMGNRDGPGARAQFLDPTGLVVGMHRHDVFVADEGNNLVRRVVTQNGMVETYAGVSAKKDSSVSLSRYEEDEEIPTFRDGPNYEACFNNPLDLAYGSDATVYLADRMNHRIRSIAYGGTYEVSTLAGTGEAASKDGAGKDEACLRTPSAITINTCEGYLYVFGGEPDAMRIVDIRYKELANRDGQPSVYVSKTLSPKKHVDQSSPPPTFSKSKIVEVVAFGASPQRRTHVGEREHPPAVSVPSKKRLYSSKTMPPQRLRDEQPSSVVSGSNTTLSRGNTVEIVAFGASLKNPEQKQ